MPQPRGSVADRIDEFLRGRKSPLAGYGKAFVRAGRKYGVDPLLMVAIAGQESSFGTYGPSRKIKNPFGWGPHIPFGSWGEAIDTVTRGMAQGYIKEGRRTIPQISTKWAPVGAANDPSNLNAHWVKGVEKFYAAVGGKTSTGTAPALTGAPAASEGAVTRHSPLVSRGPSPGLELATSVLARQASKTYDKRLGPSEDLAELAQASAVAGRELATRPGRAAVSSFPAAAAPAPAQTGGAWGGSQALARGLAEIGFNHGLEAVSEKRDRRATKSGRRSDHWVKSTDSYAFDLSGPSGEMDRSAVAIAARLGVDYDGRGPLVLTKVVDGFRYQVLYRTDVGGDHFGHIHVGVRRVGGKRRKRG